MIVTPPLVVCERDALGAELARSRWRRRRWWNALRSAGQLLGGDAAVGRVRDDLAREARSADAAVGVVTLTDGALGARRGSGPRRRPPIMMPFIFSVSTVTRSGWTSSLDRDPRQQLFRAGLGGAPGEFFSA
jgi:hypothetical protein